MNARAQLAAALEGARGQDIGLATNQAGMNQQAASNNLQANLDQTGMNDQAAIAYRKMFADSLDSMYGRRIAGQQLHVDNALGINAVNQKAYDSASTNRGNFISKLGQAAAGAA